MPLFKNKQAVNNSLPMRDSSYPTGGAAGPGAAGAGATEPTGQAFAPGSRMGATQDPQSRGPSGVGGAPGQAPMQDPNDNYDTSNNLAGQNFSGSQRGGPGSGSTGPGMQNNYGSGDAGNQGIPPAAALGTQGRDGRSSGSGKFERTVGTLIGSSSLKAKGLQKEQEANAMKIQSAELAEAERLEREALMRRERAVAHGAHPDNKHLGSSQLPGSYNQSGGGY